MFAAACGLGAATVLPFIDVLVKILVITYPILMVAWARFAIGSVLLGIAVIWRNGLSGLVPNAWGLQIVRALSAVFGTVMAFEGFRTMPLAECTALIFVAPVIANGLAWWWLAEKPDPMSWAVTLVSFIGVLLIMKPGSALFSVHALYPLSGSVGLASFLVLSRAVAEHDIAATTAFAGTAIAALVFSLAMPWHWRELASDHDIWLFLGVGAGASIANWLVPLSYQNGKTHVGAPMGYFSRVVVAVLGYLFFDELPGLLSGLGIIVILVSGCFLVIRSGLRSEASQPR